MAHATRSLRTHGYPDWHSEEMVPPRHGGLLPRIGRRADTADGGDGVGEGEERYQSPRARRESRASRHETRHTRHETGDACSAAGAGDDDCSSRCLEQDAQSARQPARSRAATRRGERTGREGGDGGPVPARTAGGAERIFELPTTSCEPRRRRGSHTNRPRREPRDRRIG